MTPPLVRFGLVVYRGDFACIRGDKDDLWKLLHGSLRSLRYILHLASSRCSTRLPMPAFAQIRRMARSSIRLLSRTNAIERPSGDHFGKESSAGSVVNRCGSAAESTTFT